MDNELDFGRYWSAFRRRRTLIALAVALGAVSGLILGLSAPLVASSILVPVDRSAQLDSAGIPPELINFRQVVGRVASELESESFAETLSDDSSVDATIVTTGDPPPVIGLTVRSSSQASVAQALDQASTFASTVYAAEFGRLYDGIVANFEEQLASRRIRLEAIEAQAAAVTGEQVVLAEGLLVSAERARSDIAELENEVAAAQRLSAGLGSDLFVLGESDAERARPPVIMALVGGVVAGGLALVLLALWVAFDRRIRTRRDLSRIGLDELIGVVSVRPEADGEVLAGALRRAVQRTGTRSVQLVPVSQAGAIPLGEIVMGCGDIGEVVDRATLGSDAAETMREAPNVLTVVKVAWGRDSPTTVMSVVNRLAAASSAPIGVVLVGVPRTELPYVER